MNKSAILFTSILIGCLQLAQASDLQRTKRIAGGEPAPITRWMVKVKMGNMSSCSGEALNNRYILTAKHCIKGTEASNIKVYYSEGPQNQPSSIANDVDKVFIAPRGDTAILYLSSPHKLDKYVDLDLNYVSLSKVYDGAYAMGYGKKLITENRDPNALYKIKVWIDGLDKRVFSNRPIGSYIETETRNGYTLGGDSGGPLLVNGKLVGTLWGSNDAGFIGYYAYLTENAQWITNTISK